MTLCNIPHNNRVKFDARTSCALRYVMPTDTRIADRVVTLIAEARAIRDGIFNDLVSVSETDVRKA